MISDRTFFSRPHKIALLPFQVHIAQTFGLEEAAQAQSAMKQHYLGKIVLRVSGE